MGTKGIQKKCELIMKESGILFILICDQKLT